MTDSITPAEIDALLATLDERVSNLSLNTDGAWVNVKLGTLRASLTHLRAMYARAIKAEVANDEAYALGKRDGYSEAVQEIDMLTGGDGEYFASTFPDRGCEDADAMKQKIVEKFEAAKAALVDHNDLLRSAFQAAQRDAIHDVVGTTNYRTLADRASDVLAKHHATTNAARAAAQASAKKEGE